jgi:protein-S-isoprenylcysteine O-methyltransferase Ste14
VKDTPGVIAPPPLIALGAIALGLGIEEIWPIDGPRHLAGGIAVFLLGFALAGWAMASFRRAGTNIQTRQPATTVVAAGPYRFTRNPIYIGMVVGILGVGLAAGSTWTMLMALPFLVVIDRGVIAREERYLAAKFGEQYDAYRGRVRRWI